MAHNWSKPIRRIRAQAARTAREEKRTQAAIEGEWQRMLRRVMKTPATTRPTIIPPRECLWCVAEAGTPRNPQATHGVCNRHSAAMRATWLSRVGQRPSQAEV